VANQEVYKELKLFLKLIVIGLSIFLFFNSAEAQDLLQKGIEQYRAENYEEALEIFNEAYKISPSTTVSFYLGLTYKQIGEARKAKEFFIKALTEKPKVNDAYVELAQILYQLGELEEAKKWLQEAESQNIMPAKVAFLNGLILMKEGRNKEARESFEKAKNLDKTIAQSADFQISLTYLSEKKIKEAKKSFEALIETSPGTDVADFAKDYLSALDRVIKSYKAWSINFITGYLYDDNVVSKPSGNIGIETVDKISGKRDSAIVNNLKINYRPLLADKLYFSGSYEFYYKNYFHTYEYDMMVHSIELTPGYNFKDGIIIFPLSYHHVWLNEREYMSLFYFRPTLNLQFMPSHIAQLSLGYGKRDILRYIKGFDPDEDRDSKQFLILLSYLYPFKEGKGLFYSRYEYIYDDTEGKNWESDSHRISLGIIYPVLNRVSLNFAGDYTWQNYRNIHTLSGKGINGFPEHQTERKDRILNISAGFGYEISRYLNLNLRYTHTRNDSNFPIYDYRRNLYNFELSFNF